MFECACGDTAYSIPEERAIETYREGAFWCSGTLNMLGYNQNPVVVMNPYSYAQLQALLSGLDRYLLCISGAGTGDFQGVDLDGESCESLRPGIAALEAQGVSSIAVLTRWGRQ